MSGVPGIVGGFCDLLVEGDDAAVVVDLDHAEVARFLLAAPGWPRRSPRRSRREVRAGSSGARPSCRRGRRRRWRRCSGRLVGDDVLALVDGVGRALEPGLAGALLRGDRLDELVEHRREAPHARDVLLERRALVLRQHLDAGEPRVDEVREDDVDDAVATRRTERRASRGRSVSGPRRWPSPPARIITSTWLESTLLGVGDCIGDADTTRSGSAVHVTRR